MEMVWDARFEALLRDALDGLPEDAPLTGQAELAALGLSSIRAMALLVALEREFDVEFDVEELDADMFTSPDSLWHALSGLMSTASH
ncbi:MULTISPECIES: phosphopantetheine-binding protein [unclassified Crossiella]|uniref:phosphopantetheine-binding protein n=1 Tax=Crossiella sp. SN42 TaxID=2944808 RepID=UPI00207C762C|nr:phosphopantetheine-binding protein [Crossiella sp. SN42]MCO1577284.1 phosphopantetheine-binding protein [Crossiella sp. SN42]